MGKTWRRNKDDWYGEDFQSNKKKNANKQKNFSERRKRKEQFLDNLDGENSYHEKHERGYN